MTDLILRQARLMSGNIVDIAITDGGITAIEPTLPEAGKTELQAKKLLTLPAFDNGQCQLMSGLC